MSSGRDFDPPEAADADPHPAPFADLEFVGPLSSADQAWAEHTLRTDSLAALFEPADNVIRRREGHIGSLYRMATLLTLSGDLAGGSAAGFRAIAESRALAEFMAANPAYCLDCFLLGERCDRHRATELKAASDAARAGPSAPGSVGSGSSATGQRPAGSPSGAGGSSPGGASPGRSLGDRAAGGSAAGSGVTGQPDWRRFGADEFPSASG